MSRNLISANQHPDVVTSNLCKEISLGRVAGPFSSSPLPNLQCHPVGVVPKKHSSKWRTIYHLSYPEGVGINDCILKDPYALQYVRVDNAICIICIMTTSFFHVCETPVIASETLGPSQVREFMGIELDSTCMEARLPEDKLRRAQDFLNSFSKRRSVRLIELQSLIGTLQLACKAVVPGRTFLQRILGFLSDNSPSIYLELYNCTLYYKKTNQLASNLFNTVLEMSLSVRSKV